MFALRSNADEVLALEIQPQLRHSNSSTTLTYLQWLADYLGINLNLHQQYAEDIAEQANGEAD